MATGTSLLAELRRRIGDSQPIHRAFGLAVREDMASRAIAEITRGHLVVTVSQNGSDNVPPVDLHLSNPRYDTLEKVFRTLDSTLGYRVTWDEDALRTQASVDLEEFGPTDILGTGIDLKTHLFSDGELLEILNLAILRHNPSLTADTLPAQERGFVFQLAHANVLREQANRAAKRRGLDTDAGVLLNLAESFERAYTEDVKRLARSIVSPKEANPNTMNDGDVVVGLITRRSPRTGFTTPMAGSKAPDAPEFVPFADNDIEDERVRIKWERNKQLDFYTLELWMDTRPEVERVRTGLVFSGTPYSLQPKTGFELKGTSKMVFRSFGSNSNSDSSTFSTFVEQFGQLVSSYIVESLEPESEYFFRIYLANINYEVATMSEPVAVRTKPLRTRFSLTTPASVTSAVAGQLITLEFRADRGPITANHKILLGGKVVAHDVITPTLATITVPSFVHTGPKDLAVVSPTGLVDVLNNYIQVY